MSFIRLSDLDDKQVYNETYYKSKLKVFEKRKQIARLACKYLPLIRDVIQSPKPDLERMLNLHQKFFELNESELKKMKMKPHSIACSIEKYLFYVKELDPKHKTNKTDAQTRKIPNLKVCTPPKSGSTNWSKALWQLKYFSELGILVDKDDKRYINYTNLYQGGAFVHSIS